MATTTDEATTRRAGSLVLAGLFGPAAWVVFIVVTYLLEDPLACTPGVSAKGEVLGVSIRGVAAGVSIVLALATYLFAALSFAWWRGLRESNSTDRRPWMALTGILNNVLFGTIFLVGIAPAVMLRTCTPSP